MSKIDIKDKYVLTLTEASLYFSIGIDKLRFLIAENDYAEWKISNGNRTLIKRIKFEKFIDETDSL